MERTSKQQIVCIDCGGTGYQEPHSAGTFLEPYPCQNCSEWSGDPDDVEFWDAENRQWRAGVGSHCETES